MNATQLWMLSLAFCLVAPGCAKDDDAIDQTLLAEYKRALPAMSNVAAPQPTASTSALLGEPALYPGITSEVVEGVNGSVVQLVAILELITSFPPTVYNSDTLEFAWGPFPNEDGVGYWAAYIRDVGDGEDFRYHYAILRGIDNNVANLIPVVWGAGTPDPNDDDLGVGVAVWDFEANAAFEEEYNPDYDPAELEHGRFATVFGKGLDTDNNNEEFAFVVSVFRNFVTKDDPEADPADLDYFYGRYYGTDAQLDFLDIEATYDVDEDSSAQEDVGIRLAFLDEGTGRAEADVTGGDLGASTIAVTECWDTSLDQSYVDWDGTEDGMVSDCGAIFVNTLDDLQIPSLQDVDAEILSALDDVAENGIPQRIAGRTRELSPTAPSLTLEAPPMSFSDYHNRMKTVPPVSVIGLSLVSLLACGGGDDDAGGGDQVASDGGGIDGPIQGRADAMPGVDLDASAVPDKRVFVTSSTHTGNLGGLDGADQICMTRASEGQLPGTFKAWVSINGTSAGDRMTHGTVPYTRTDDIRVANDWDDLVDGTLANAISRDEDGQNQSGDVWTGTLADGSTAAATCANFTSGNVASSGLCGDSSAKDDAWTDNIVPACSVQLRIYCIEQ